LFLGNEKRLRLHSTRKSTMTSNGEGHDEVEEGRQRHRREPDGDGNGGGTPPPRDRRQLQQQPQQQQRDRRRRCPLECAATLWPPLKKVGGGGASSENRNNDDNNNNTDNNNAMPPPSSGRTGRSKTLELAYREPQPAWQCHFSRDGSRLAVAYGSPDPCVRIWRRRNGYGGGGGAATTTTKRRNDVPVQSRQQQQDKGKPEKQKGNKNEKNDKKDEDDDPRVDSQEATSDETATEWVLETTLTGIHARTVRWVSFAPVPDPSVAILASASFDGTVAIWESYGGAADPLQLGEWDCAAQLEGHESEVKCVAWNASASLLATCGRDKMVWIWECFLPGTIGGPAPSSANGRGRGAECEFECLAVLSGHDGDVKCVAFCASHGVVGDGDEILLSASYDDTVRIWAEEAGDWYAVASIANCHSSTIWTLAVSPSQCRFVSGSADGSLAIYKCYTDTNVESNEHWKCVGKLECAHRSPGGDDGGAVVYSVSYASVKCGHGRLASGGADSRINVYREARGSTSDHPLFELEASAGTPSDVNCVCWHPCDGTVIASTGDDGAVRIWRYNCSSD